ncbi:protein prenylyltransferase [Mycena albidolilacea]|uniref:Protein prenylyltransferase n=1 Tax=Mycena albidolilacea TaxID=1033008 RepID=A0AAD7AE95_9AGAR|nr:protein prenylyltransferase [Mycena albidolilacea]
MAKKSTKSKKKSPTEPSAANGANGNQSEPSASTSASPVVERTPSPPAPEPEHEEEEEEEGDILLRAEKVKEQGNVAFKAKRFGDALDLYTKAIEMNPAEPSFLTNRAAAYMGIKRFRAALDDCQAAATLQAAAPSAKTLLRLARCQFALGSTTPALSTLRAVLALEPKNAPALQLQSKISLLEGHLRNFENAKVKKEWAHARLALDKCLQGIEGEGGEIPTDWRLWRVELELARGNLEAANTAANDALRLNPSSPDVLTSRGLVLFLSGRLPQALQHAQSALRGDPGHEPAQRLRKRVKDVERLKEEGNAAFKTARFEEAIGKYGEALERVGDAEEEGRGGQIRATLLSNRATALLKLDRHDDALLDTDASLLLTPTSFKALRTRARIHLHLEHYDQCVADFKLAIQHVSADGAAGDADVRALKTELKKAEAALKRSKTKDYYKILGVARDCSEAEVRKGYRRESLKHHPDKGGDEEKFKLVVEANAVLSDPARRERYDMGEDEDGMSDSSGMGGMGGMDLSELFAQFHGGGGGGGFGGGGGGFGGGGFGGGGFRQSGFGGGGGMHSHGGGRSHGSHGFGGF